MKHTVLGKSPVGYPASSYNVIARKLTKTSPGWDSNEGGETGKVYISDTQFFAKVPKSAWEFYIGGYQPAQKWLKDRKGRALDREDVQHYRKIIKALLETERLMGEIDGVVDFSNPSSV